METKFTPGSWWCHLAMEDVACNCNSILGEGQDGMGSIATIHYNGEGTHGAYEGEYPSLEEAKANARLISSAPDMFVLLRDMARNEELSSRRFEQVVKLLWKIDGVKYDPD